MRLGRLGITEAIEHSGYAIFPRVLDDAAVQRLQAAIAYADDAASSRQNQVYARRNLLEQVPEVAELAECETIRRFVATVLGEDAQPVRAIFYDKVADANWHAGWHQDLIIPVSQRYETEGFSAWSEKAGVPHVKPPTEVLEQMLTVRVHLDDCGPDNGPLRVLPGTHCHGEFSNEEIRHLLDNQVPEDCCVRSGGIVIMRPLLVHSSSPAQSPEHRRVVHLEFATGELPGDLEWHRPGARAVSVG